jgi:hypothetical protein
MAAVGRGCDRVRSPFRKRAPPLTVPKVLGEALTVIVYGLGLTVSAAARVVFP